MALIGANGAGKTTTLRMLVNILRPESGRATVLGVDSRRLTHREFARIGYVSENQELPAGLTVGQYFAYLRRLYETWDDGLERDLRDRLEIPAARKLGKLSHGMRMKVALAAALPFRPELLILDEPLSGLDPLVRDEVVEGLLDQADGMTIVISSHELSEIEGFASHVAFIDAGRLLFQEPIEALTARFRDVTVVLEEPAHVPMAAPQTWLNPRAAGAALTFVETAYADDRRLAHDLSAFGRPVRRFDARPMSLRDISKTLIRATRKEPA
jgi:ABC-2 type transport system ATP-binding protein